MPPLIPPSSPLPPSHMGFHAADSDPDSSLSYLGQKVSLLLGHAQKAFEGGASNDKLGSMVGGYGSFLPVREHDPPILHHEDRHPPISDVAPPEVAAADKGRIAAASCASTVVNGSKSSLEAILLSKESANRDATPAKEMALHNADNSSASNDYKNGGPPQKKVMLRIKIGPDNDTRRKNATVYKDFGLSNSSSGLDDDDNDEDEDQVSDFDVDSSPEKSPSSMIRRMTLDHIPGGRLLSPFIPDITKRNSVQKEQAWSENAESLNHTTVDIGIQSRLIKDDRKKVEKLKEKASCKGKDGSKVEPKRDKRSSMDGDKHARSSSNTPLKHAVDQKEEKIIDDIVRGTDVRKASHNGSRLDGEAVESFSHEGAHVQKRFCDPQGNAHQYEKVVVSSRQDSMHPPDDTDQHSRGIIRETSVSDSRMQKKRPPKASTENSQGKKQTLMKEDDDVYEGKSIVIYQKMKETSKSKNMETSGKPTGDISKNIADTRRHSKDSLKDVHQPQASAKDRGKGHLKEAGKSFSKEKSSKEASMCDMPKDSEPRKSHDYSSKPVNKEPHQRFPLKLQKPETSELRREEKLKEKLKLVTLKKDASKSYDNRFQESAFEDLTNKSAEVTLQIPAYNASEFGNLDPGVGSVPVPSVLITENWVCCDKCEKWRLLPPGVENESLPKKWVCKMLYWLELGMNNCNMPEETTTDATRVLYSNVTHQQAPILAEPMATMQAPLPTNALAVVSSTITDDFQATRTSDGNRPIINKKRKSCASASEEIVSNKCTDARQTVRDNGHVKLSSRTSSESNQAKKMKCPDSGFQVGEEYNAKKREKTMEKMEPKEQKRERGKEVEKGKEKNNREKKEKVRQIEREMQIPESRNSARLNDHEIPSIEEKDSIEQSTITLLLRDAMNLKCQAELHINKTRADNKGTALYLQAALKFLEAASMLESQGGEHNENLPINIYEDTAELCEFCAGEYERRKDLAAAALAYKCAGLAYMRVIQAKSSTILKDRAEISTVSQQGATGNPGLQSHPTIDDLEPSSLHSQSNMVLIPKKNRASLQRILKYVENTTAAMEAVTKSNSAFSAYAASTNTEGLSAVKKVVDFGIHDVKSFISLIQLALKAIGN